MSWLTETLFPRRTTAETRAAFYAEQAAAEREAKEFAQGNLKRLARKLDDHRRRLERQADTIADLREELAKQKRVNDRLSSQLLDVTGHNGHELTPEQRRTLGIPAGGAR
jgi:hypothetical protein